MCSLRLANIFHFLINYLKKKIKEYYTKYYIYLLPFCCFLFSLYESPPKGHQLGSINRKSPLYWTEGRKRNCTSPKGGKLPSPQRQEQESRGADSHSPRSSSPSPRPPRRTNLSHHGSNLDIGTPDIIIEELVDVGQQRGVLPVPIRTLNCTGWSQKKSLNQFF